MGAKGMSPGGTGSGMGTTPPASCTAAPDATHAAVCVSAHPEAIDYSTTDPSFDGKGVLWVAAYQSPLATPASLLKETYVGSAKAPVDLRALQAVRLDGIAPGTVYLRVVMFDGTFAPAEPPSAGWWVGGYDLKGGIENAPLLPVTTKAGAASKLDIDLVLLRKLTVTVRREQVVLPVGDGRGPLRAIASPTDSLDTQTSIPYFGEAGAKCGDLSSAANSAALSGYVVGKGPYWIFAVLDDFGVGGLGPDGSLVSIAGTTPTAILLPQENVTDYAPRSPTVSVSVMLNTGVPRKSITPDATTCQ
jgi:hypothetical protein